MTTDANKHFLVTHFALKGVVTREAEWKRVRKFTGEHGWTRRVFQHAHVGEQTVEEGPSGLRLMGEPIPATNENHAPSRPATVRRPKTVDPKLKRWMRRFSWMTPEAAADVERHGRGFQMIIESHGKNPCHPYLMEEACSYRSLPVAEALHAAGASVRKQSLVGWQSSGWHSIPLAAAVCTQRAGENRYEPALVEQLLEWGADPNECAPNREGRDDHSQSPMHAAVATPEAFRRLVKAGGNPNLVGPHGDVPLFALAWRAHIDADGARRHLPALKAAVEAGADVNRPLRSLNHATDPRPISAGRVCLDLHTLRTWIIPLLEAGLDPHRPDADGLSFFEVLTDAAKKRKPGKSLDQMQAALDWIADHRPATTAIAKTPKRRGP